MVESTPNKCEFCGRLQGPSGDRRPYAGTEHYYAKGLCKNCYARASNNKRKHGVFDPNYQPKHLPVVSKLKPAIRRLLAGLLDLPPEIDGRRFTRIGAEIAARTGVFRQRIHQLLSRMQRRGWIRFQIKIDLPPEVEAYVRNQTEEEPKILLDSWTNRRMAGELLDKTPQNG